MSSAASDPRMVPNSSTVTAAGQGEPENPPAQHSWEAVASEVSAEIEKAVAPIVKRASEDLYASVLEATQDYLADNLAFNIASRVETADREAARYRQELKAERSLVAELLEALSWFIDDIDGTHTVMVDFDANVERARAVIAKARGEQVPA